MSEALSYDDVLLVPRYSDIRSRTEVSTKTDLGNGLTLELPIIASPMDTISETAMAIAAAGVGGTAIIHRYCGIEMQSRMVQMALDVAKSKYDRDINIGAAIGVSGDFIERAKTLLQSGATFLCLDVAHGHHIMMKEAIEGVRNIIGDDVHLMAGNVATIEGINHLADWGVDSVRCNIGGGCFTAGTLVRTTNGDKAIEQIMIGEEVYTHTGAVRPVVDTLSFDRDEEIVVINGIETTTNHEFYVVDKADAELITDDNIGDYARWIEAEHLDKSRHLLVEIS
jgi:IMP dehydrogenase/GMP reductase